MKPLVSIVTPTWGRHERLLNRCVPSVQAQTYAKTEHVIVSDGPDPELAGKLAELASGAAFYHPVRYVQLPAHDPEPHWGHRARLEGIESSGGELIGYVDDDDALRPEHCEHLARLFAPGEPEIGWAYSVMASHSHSGAWTDIGYGPPACGQIGTPMLMHRRETLRHGTWGPASSVEDWQLVERWLKADVPYVSLAEVTVDVWPSSYWS